MTGQCIGTLSSSCLGRGRFLFVMPAVPGLLLLLQLLQALGLVGPQHGVPQAAIPELPVVLAVLVDQAHLRLAQDGQQVLVLAGARGPGAGLERREGRAARLHQDVVDGAAGQDHQLQLNQGMLEVLLRGGALVDAAVRGLERADQKAFICLQDAPL